LFEQFSLTKSEKPHSLATPQKLEVLKALLISVSSVILKVTSFPGLILPESLRIKAYMLVIELH